MTDFRALCAELTETLARHQFQLEGSCHPTDLESQRLDESFYLLSRARAALAQPEPQGPTDEELDEETATLIPWLLEEAVQAANSEAPYAAGQLTLAAQLLGERRPAIEPVPVAERLPGPEDCDAEGRCFVWDWLATEWRFLERNVFEYGWEDAYWLPHHALPVPHQEVNDD